MTTSRFEVDDNNVEDGGVGDDNEKEDLVTYTLLQLYPFTIDPFLSTPLSCNYSALQTKIPCMTGDNVGLLITCKMVKK